MRLRLFTVLLAGILFGGYQAAGNESVSVMPYVDRVSSDIDAPSVSDKSNDTPPEGYDPEPFKTIDIDSVAVIGLRPMDDIGIQKTVFSEKILREDVTFSIADMLSKSSPAFIKSYGRGTMATVSFRGTSSSHTRVTWNGMRINSPLFGTADLSYIPSYFIDGASLYHGASSVGTTGGGLGGAIALDTKPTAESGFGLRYIQGVASFRTFDEYLKFSYGGKRIKSETSVLLTTSENDFLYTNYAKKDFVLDGDGNVTGWSYPKERNRNCSYRDFHILQEVYYDGGAAGDFGLSAWYMDSSRGLPLLNTDYSELNSSKSVQAEKTFRGVVRWDKHYRNHKFAAKAGYNYSDMHYYERTERIYGDSELEVQTRTDWISYINTVFGDVSWEHGFSGKLYMVANLTLLQNFVYTRNGQPVRDESTPVAYNDTRTELSGLVSLRYRPVKRVGLAVNLRQEVIGNEGAPFIPALLADWTLGRNENVVLKASVARNYRYPTINDNHFAKAPLSPEDGFTYDFGVDVKGKNGGFSYTASLTAYDSYIHNWIFWYPDKGSTQWLPSNIKMVHAYGVEAKADAGWAFGDWRATAGGIFSWTRSINMREPINGNDNAVGKQLPYIPELSGSLNVRLEWKMLNVGYKWNYYSERFTTTDNSALITGRIAPYFMNDVSAGVNLSLGWSDININLKVNNIFNEEYETELSHPMPGRNYGISLEIVPRFGKRK